LEECTFEMAILFFLLCVVLRHYYAELTTYIFRLFDFRQLVTSPFRFFQEKLENSNIKEGLLESLGGETLTVSKGDGHNTITMFNGHSSVIIKPDIQVSMFLQGILKGEVSLYHGHPV
jgi:hypothetical protein